MRYENWWESITPEMGIALEEGSGPQPARAGDVFVEIAEDKSRNRAFVVDRLGRSREVETIPIIDGMDIPAGST